MVGSLTQQLESLPKRWWVAALCMIVVQFLTHQLFFMGADFVLWDALGMLLVALGWVNCSLAYLLINFANTHGALHPKGHSYLINFGAQFTAALFLVQYSTAICTCVVCLTYRKHALRLRDKLKKGDDDGEGEAFIKQEMQPMQFVEARDTGDTIAP